LSQDQPTRQIPTTMQLGILIAIVIILIGFLVIAMTKNRDRESSNPQLYTPTFSGAKPTIKPSSKPYVTPSPRNKPAVNPSPIPSITPKRESSIPLPLPSPSPKSPSITPAPTRTPEQKTPTQPPQPKTPTPANSPVGTAKIIDQNISDTSTPALTVPKIISFNYPRTIPSGENISCEVTVEDESEIATISLFYRKGLEDSWRLIRVNQLPGGRNTRTIMIPGYVVSKKGLEIYLEVTNSLGSKAMMGSPANPLKISIERRLPAEGK
jgi:hypothetical protein